MRSGTWLRALVPCLTWLAWAGSIAAQAPPAWEKYVSKEGRFTATFPGKPMESQEDIPGLDGRSAVQKQFVVGQEKGAYLVSYQDEPRMAKADAKAVAASFDKIRDGLAKKVEGKVTLTKAIKIGTHAGQEFELNVPKVGGVFRYRLYFVDGRYYQVFVVGQRGFVESKDADRFLDSFQLATGK